MRFKFFIFFVALYGIPLISNATTHRYIAPMEASKWRMIEATALHCKMEHVIPNFGRVIFSRDAGRELGLTLLTNQRYNQGISVDLVSESPHWKRSNHPFKLASLKTTGRDTTIHDTMIEVPSNLAKAAYMELDSGFQPGFLLSTGESQNGSITALMSTVRFRDVIPAFEQCIAGLYYQNFDDVKLSKIHFEHDNEFPLMEEERSAFTDILNYLKVDKSIKQIVISGHADYTGTDLYNDTLSSRRAWYTHDLLVQLGVDPNLLRVKYYGELQPIRKGKAEEDLAANRRVIVELKR